MALPIVAIVGAPNVGKSRLFNRLVGRRRAIVGDEPGVTRDRLYGVSQLGNHAFEVVDTGGLTLDGEHPLSEAVERQAGQALVEAAAVLFVVDGRSEPTALDAELARRLRGRGAPLLLVANKVDAPGGVPAAELWGLGLGPPFAVSAEHGHGVSELVAALESLLPDAGEVRDTAPEPAVAVAIVGRPNVGKSSLLNRLVGRERVLVDETAGTTRDAIDTLFEHGGRRYRLIDTAGLRRAGRVQAAVEHVSTHQARESLARADVALLVLDATASFAAQDAHVAGAIRQALKPMVVAVNKWDRIEGREQAAKDWEQTLRRRLRFAPHAPFVFVSARSGQRIFELLERTDEVHRQAGLRVPTQALNRWLQRASGGSRETPGRDGPGLRLFYATQTGIHPPSFLIFCNHPELVHFSARRRLENGLREGFGFGAAPLRLEFRGRRAP